MPHLSKMLFLVLAVLVVQTPAARPDETAKELLERAYKAHGGFEKLSKFKATTVKGKGIIYLPVAEVSFTSEGAAQLPDKFKSVLQFEINGMKVTQLQMLVGGKATILLNGAPQELTDKVTNEMKEQVYVEQVTSLVPLREPAYALTALGESKIDGQPSLGIKVSSKGHRDVSLYFDKKTALLVKAAYKAFDPNADKEVTQEQTYRDYKDQDGVKYAAKSVVMQDDKKFMDIEVTEYKSLEKLDNSVFKP
jgi:hypothetical protein